MLQDDIKATVKFALEEDLGGKLDPTLDVTSQLIDENETDEATVITREAGVFCGKAWVEEVYNQLGNKATLTWFVKDGDAIEPGQQLFHVQGNARSMLTAERTT